MFSHNIYINPSLNKKFEGIIWKIEIDDKFPVIAIETRHAETHTTTFSAFNFQTGDCLFMDVTVENSWHWALDRVSNKTVFIHSYLTDQTPEHNGIIALDEQGSIKWQHHNKALQDIAEEGLIVSDPKVQGKWVEIISPETGLTVKSFVQTYTPVTRNITVPLFLPNKESAPIILPDEVRGEIAFLKYKDKDIACYHVETAGSFTQQLLISLANKVILIDNLEVGILKRNPEAFFINRDHLFCIRDEKREIVSYLV